MALKQGNNIHVKSFSVSDALRLQSDCLHVNSFKATAATQQASDI